MTKFDEGETMCGNGCRCAKADMSVEEVVEPGTVVEVHCTQCDGTGENKYNSASETDCWRCGGTGVQKCITEPRSCPSCGVSWIGGQIAKKSMGLYGATHFGNELGIYRFDHTVAYRCPNPKCGAYVSRFGEQRILSEEEVMRGTYKELIG